VASLYTDHSQGSLKKTGNTLDLAIEGDGYFVIQTPAGERYTRNGNLILDAEGFLATQMGNRLLGPKGEPIQIDTAGGRIDIDSKGFISVGSGLENQPAGQLKLAAIEAKSNLTKEGNGLYKLTGGGTVKEGAKNFSVRQGFLELSNVNSVEEMTKMITTLRAFEAYQKVIQAIDGADDLAVNSIGRIA
jgi:flagellar basal-body rod protein FlgF